MATVFWLEDEPKTAALPEVCEKLGIEMNGPHPDPLTMIDALTDWKGSTSDVLIAIDILKPLTHWVRTFDNHQVNADPGVLGLKFVEANLCGRPHDNDQAQRWRKVPIVILTQLKIEGEIEDRISRIEEFRNSGPIHRFDKYHKDEAEMMRELEKILKCWKESLTIKN